MFLLFCSRSVLKETSIHSYPCWLLTRHKGATWTKQVLKSSLISSVILPLGLWGLWTISWAPNNILYAKASRDKYSKSIILFKLLSLICILGFSERSKSFYLSRLPSLLPTTPTLPNNRNHSTTWGKSTFPYFKNTFQYKGPQTWIIHFCNLMWRWENWGWPCMYPYDIIW